MAIGRLSSKLLLSTLNAGDHNHYGPRTGLVKSCGMWCIHWFEVKTMKSNSLCYRMYDLKFSLLDTREPYSNRETEHVDEIISIEERMCVP